MTFPKKSTLFILGLSGLALASIYVVKTIYPPVAAISSPDLDRLRVTKSSLATFTRQHVQESDQRLQTLRQHLWSKETFDNFRKNLPAGWSVRDLGMGETKHVPTRRFAFQRPTANDKDWTEIIGVLRDLETQACANVTSVTLAAGVGFAESRKFSQCQFIAVLFCTGDDGPK